MKILEFEVFELLPIYHEIPVLTPTTKSVAGLYEIPGNMLNESFLELLVTFIVSEIVFFVPKRSFITSLISFCFLYLSSSFFS